jgi:Na+/proline symporter
MAQSTPTPLLLDVEIHPDLGRLHNIDIGIILLYLVLSVAIGVMLSRRGRASAASFFNSGGKMPWYLLGTSMIATTFAADTPLALSGFVSSNGISQNWFWWCTAMMTMFGVFFFARLWRRAQLSTDTELVAIRYSGKSARVLRTFRAVYLSMFYSIIIMGWVNLAMVKVISGILSPMDLRIAAVDGPLSSVLEWTGFVGKTQALSLSAEEGAAGFELEIARDGDPFIDGQKRVQEKLSVLTVTVTQGGQSETLDLLQGDHPRTIRGLMDQLDAMAGVRAAPFGGTALLDHSIDRLASQTLTVSGSELDHLRIYSEPVGGRLSRVLTAKLLFILFIITVSYCAVSGFWGVVVTDFIQFIIAMAGAIYLAIAAIALFGGLGPMTDHATQAFGAADTQAMLAMIPPASPPEVDPSAVLGSVDREGTFKPMLFEAFLIFVLVFWFSVGFTDGGNVYAQRMIGARSERDAMLAYLWYGVGNFCLRMWPWLLVGLAGVILFPNLAAQQAIEPSATTYDPEMNYIYTMRVVLGPGLMGLVVASFLAAYMSTISTHLNISASYLVSDVYRAEISKGRDEKHYVRVATVVTLVVAVLGIVTTLFLSSIKDAWFLVASLNSGIGIVYLLRWYWWRINAWSELSCMVALLVGTLLIQGLAWGDDWERTREQGVPYTGSAPAIYINALDREGALATINRAITLRMERKWEVPGPDGTTVTMDRSVDFGEVPFSILLLLPFSAAVWISVTFLTKPADKQTLISFFRRVRPGGPGWRRIARECPEIPASDTLLNRRNFVCWLLAVVAIYASLFGMSNIFFFSTARGLMLLALAGVAAWRLALLLREDGIRENLKNSTNNPSTEKSQQGQG